MSPAMEEGAKVASSFMEAMKSQPLALALVLCNLTLLALFFYVASLSSGNRAKEFQSILQMQREVQQLLYQCTPPAPRG
jgi:hypothetical protein